jgi:hypothetical protein
LNGQNRKPNQLIIDDIHHESAFSNWMRKQNAKNKEIVQFGGMIKRLIDTAIEMGSK